MGWLGKVTGALIVSLLSATLLAAFQKPIADYFAPDKLSATVQIGPWFPIGLTEKDTVDRTAREAEIGEESATSLTRENATFAKVTVRNDGSKIVTRLKVQFGESRHIVLIPKQDHAGFKFAAQSIDLPDLNPGDAVVFYAWQTYGMMDFAVSRKWRTYSSEGGWHVNIHKAQLDEDLVVATGFDNFVTNWIPWIILAGLLLLATTLGITTSINFTYAKDLLSDSRFYISERDRFSTAPDKFEINMSAHGQYLAAFRLERLRASKEKQAELEAEAATFAADAGDTSKA